MALVKVLEDATLLGLDRRAIVVKKGQLVEVAGGRYLASLIEDGFVEMPKSSDTAANSSDSGEQGMGDDKGSDPKSLLGVDGVTPSVANKLIAQGIDSAEALAGTEAAQVAAVAGVSAKKAATLIGAAKTAVSG